MSLRHKLEREEALAIQDELAELDLGCRQWSTRFRLFPQSPLLSAYDEPETVCIPLSPGEIGAGPSDARMYIADAVDKPHYEDPYLPPYRGPEQKVRRAGAELEPR